MSRTFDTTTQVWLTPYSRLGPQDLATVDRLDGLTLAEGDMTSAGWALVGTAAVTITVTTNTETIVAAKVTALRGEAQKIRADAEVKALRIEDQIQQLLAITYTPTPAPTTAPTEEAA